MSEFLKVRVKICILIFFLFFLIKLYQMAIYIALLEWINTEKNISTVGINKTTNNPMQSNSTKLNWDPTYVKYLQGAYFWGNFCTKIPAGIIGKRYGPRKIIGIFILITSVLCSLIPLSAKFHPICTGIVQFLLGATGGLLLPTVYIIATNWIPKTDRSKFMACFQGMNVGGVLGYPLHGFIVVNYGWEYIFYVNTILGLIWLIFWWIFAFDSPHKHPSISLKEKQYLFKEIDHVNLYKTYTIPWRAIFTSVPVWAVILAAQGSFTIGITLGFQLPTYFSQVHHLDIKTNSIFLGIVGAATCISSFIFAPIMDALIKYNILSITKVRKLAVAIGLIGAAISLLAVNYWGSDNQIIALIFLTLTVVFDGGTSSAGHFANAADIAPNFSSIISGMVHTTTVIPGAVLPIIIGFVLSEKHTSMEWFTVFLIVDAILIFTCLMFLTFGSGDVQHWNDESKEVTENENEIKLLRINKENLKC